MWQKGVGSEYRHQQRATPSRQNSQIGGGGSCRPKDRHHRVPDNRNIGQFLFIISINHFYFYSSVLFKSNTSTFHRRRMYGSTTKFKASVKKSSGWKGKASRSWSPSVTQDIGKTWKSPNRLPISMWSSADTATHSYGMVYPNKSIECSWKMLHYDFNIP